MKKRKVIKNFLLIILVGVLGIFSYKAIAEEKVEAIKYSDNGPQTYVLYSNGQLLGNGEYRNETWENIKDFEQNNEVMWYINNNNELYLNEYYDIPMIKVDDNVSLIKVFSYNTLLYLKDGNLYHHNYNNFTNEIEDKFTNVKMLDNVKEFIIIGPYYEETTVLALTTNGELYTYGKNILVRKSIII